MHFQTTVEISAPAARVWDVLADVTTWPSWTSSVTSAELSSGELLGLGAEVRVRQPRLAPAVWRVTRFEAGRSFQWTSSSGGVTSVADHVLTDLNGMTHVLLTVDQSGLLAPLIGLAFGGLTRRYMRTEAEGLKRRSEQAGPIKP
jgi:uncharacterized membrane protein